jgi:hypothetical protein
LRTGVHAVKRSALMTTVFTAVVVLLVPLAVGCASQPRDVAAAGVRTGVGSIATTSVFASDSSGPLTTTAGFTKGFTLKVRSETKQLVTNNRERQTRKPVPSPAPEVAIPAPQVEVAPESDPVVEAVPEAQGCPGDAGGGVGGAPGYASGQGVAGTTSDDLASFAYQYNAIRVANCLQPVPYGNFYYDSCMEARLFWMAESPSPDPLDAWGHMGSTRSDGVPSTGCDGNLAGGSDNSGATVAQKWWDSLDHRASLYRPDSSVDGVCIAFALTHGGVDEPYSFTRSAARWTGC